MKILYWLVNVIVLIITKGKLKLLDSRIRDLKISGDFGRLPNNISANWGGFTAEQWKTWTLVYSSYTLHGLLSDKDFKIWHMFVTACRKLVAPVISFDNARFGCTSYFFLTMQLFLLTICCL